ncbi:MAG TPA: class I SAM-dependent methyltransferase [Planctomycetota bacterium]
MAERQRGSGADGAERENGALPRRVQRPSTTAECGHARVLAILRRLAPGRVLDIPAGTGPVTEGARAHGHDVIGLDLFPGRGQRVVGGDACAPLPFRDAVFDAVLSLEGIEHFEDQTGFLREVARVLRPGGTLILSTPNVLHLSARVSTFLTGQRLAKHGFVNEVSTLRSKEGTRLYHGHAYLIDAFRLRYILRVVGLRLVGLETTARSPTSLALAPLLPVLWAATRWSLRSGRRRLQRERRPAPGPELEQELARVALSPALLFGKKLIYVAEREGAPVEREPSAKAHGDAQGTEGGIGRARRASRGLLDPVGQGTRTAETTTSVTSSARTSTATGASGS